MSPTPRLRLVLAVSLDGRLAPPGGGAAQLGGPGDRQVLEEALAWADGCLIGARTLRLHGGTCLIHRPGLLEGRMHCHRPPQPIALVVSRGGVLDPALPFFSQPLERWLLQAEPPASSSPELLDGAPPAGFSRRVPLTTWRQSLAALQQLGLERLVVLGGAELAAALLAEGLVDELQLTLCPVLLGGPHGWLPWDAAIVPKHWELVEQRALGEGELLLRYGKAGDPDPVATAASRPEPGPAVAPSRQGLSSRGARSAAGAPAGAHP